MLEKFGFADLHNSDRVIVEHSRHVLRREFVGGVGDQ